MPTDQTLLDDLALTKKSLIASQSENSTLRSTLQTLHHTLYTLNVSLLTTRNDSIVHLESLTLSTCSLKKYDSLKTRYSALKHAEQDIRLAYTTQSEILNSSNARIDTLHTSLEEYKVAFPILQQKCDSLEASLRKVTAQHLYTTSLKLSLEVECMF
jgi:hypothetical protein